MNSRILLSGTTILASLTLVVGATFAFFSDTATSTDNTFGTGTMTLHLDNSEDVTGTFAVTDLEPGGDANAADVTLTKASGSTDIFKVGFGVSMTSDAASMAPVLNLKVFEDSSVSAGACASGTEVTADVLAGVVDNDADGELDFGDFADSPDSLFDSLFDDGAGFDNAGSENLCLEVTLDEDAGDSIQGQSATATFTFKALQDSLQTP